MITLQEVKEYARIDIDDDDQLIKTFIIGAEQYLKNATGKDYPEIDEEGNKANYELEKIYLKLLIAYWYEQRSPVIAKANKFEVGEEFGYMTKSLMLQLQNK